MITAKEAKAMTDQAFKDERNIRIREVLEFIDSAVQVAAKKCRSTVEVSCAHDISGDVIGVLDGLGFVVSDVGREKGLHYFDVIWEHA